MPGGVTAVANSPSQITISWDASSDAGTGVGGYRVMRNGSQVADGIQVTRYVDTGLQPQTAYTYAVHALDRASPPNISAASATMQVTTLPAVDTTPPTVPANVQAVATGSSSIRVTWSASSDSGSGVGGYEVFRNGGASPLGSVAGTSFDDSGLTASTAYTYRVRAFDNANPGNYSAQSSQASATTGGAGQSGLDTRPSNTTCVAPARPVVSATASFARAYPNLTFTQPIALIRRPGDGTRWYVGEKTGRLRWFVNSAAMSTSTLALDISARVVDPDTGDERGFLGVAFHPDFARNGRIYVNYITSGPERTRISEFTSANGGDTFNPASERVLLEVNQPASNHNGGNLAFGPDGYLYVG
ncbi:MAG: fibronectin type III domain-containing protein, partial [Burkholderiales bacterium]